MRKDSCLLCHLQQKSLKSNWKKISSLAPKQLFCFDLFCFSYPTLAGLLPLTSLVQGEVGAVHTHTPSRDGCLSTIALSPSPLPPQLLGAVRGEKQRCEKAEGCRAAPWRPRHHNTAAQAGHEMVAKVGRDTVAPNPRGSQEVRAGAGGCRGWGRGGRGATSLLLLVLLAPGGAQSRQKTYSV